jgi:serine/threonine protein kinase
VEKLLNYNNRFECHHNSVNIPLKEHSAQEPTLSKSKHLIKRVKLGIDGDTGKKYAVKVMKKSHPGLDQKFFEIVMAEVNTMKQLAHANIVNLIEFNESGQQVKEDGSTKEVVYIVLELATGGELFDYVATTGRFSEEISRFYFSQLIDGIEYLHKQGIVHRDLKPENLLFDEDYNLKVADFGFSAPLSGKDGSGTLKTRLGTESYMAPEIHLRQPYNGASVDLFATGIILFIMVTQHPPFSKADPNDPFYRLLCSNRAELFWKAHSKNKPGKEAFFTDEFKDLITAMLQFDPTHRLSIAEIKSHPWLKKAGLSINDVQKEFSERKAKLDAEAEAKRIMEAEKKKAAAARVPGASAGGRRQVYRGEGDELMEAEELAPIKIDRDVQKYMRVMNKTTEMFSTFDPETLLGLLAEFAKNSATNFEISDKTYKVLV